MALTVSGGIPGNEMLVFIVVPGFTLISGCCWGGGFHDGVIIMGTGAACCDPPNGDCCWLGVVCGQEAYVGMLIGVCWMVGGAGDGVRTGVSLTGTGT